ncbi:MAG TPA: SprB repeat-containing protein, partial [Flavobacterium sp.]|uniref:SprB repeat-containing protein n=1 Tax=Flavobacterium sp. TaxID=239 RepID=UPI002DB61F19
MKNKMTFEFLETIWSGIKCCLSSKRIVSGLDFTKSQFICQEGIGKVTRSLLLSLLFFLCFSTAFAQLNLPNEKRCTSKDLELVGARLFDQGECIECETGDGVTRTLILSIKNSTGSNRTSFAFWGILDKIDSDGTINSFPITGCNSKAVPPNTSAVPPNTTTDLEFNDISYICGQRLVIRNLYLAWTSAADNASCPLDPSKIAPKCGTLPSIEINAGVNGTVTSENATCTAGGSIKVAPFGGTPPYKVSLDGGTIFNVAAGGSKTFTGLAANSSHNVTITDSTLPTACSVTKNETVGGPTALPKPEATVTQQPTCTIAKGTVTVTSFTVGDGITYRLKQGIDIKYTA